MSLITQYSRISHHTISGSMSATFSIPPSEDFTDGTWKKDGTELALSEFGVNEDSKKLYVRINDEIKEIEFVGGTAGGESLSDTLAVGNTTGANDIIISTSQSISSSNGSGKIELDWIGNPNTIILSSDNTAVFDKIVIDPNQTYNGTGIYNDNTINNDMYSSIVLIGGHIEETSANSFTNVTSKLTIDATNGTGINSESITTGNISSIGLNEDKVILAAVDVASTITDTISLDPQLLTGGTGIKSEDTTIGNISQTTYTPNTIISTATDTATTITDTISIDPQGLLNGTGIKSTDGTTQFTEMLFNTFDVSIQALDLSTSNNGNLSMNNQLTYLQQVDVASTVTDTITIDPQGLGNQTSIRSENATSGNYSTTTLVPDRVILFATDATQAESKIEVNNYTLGGIYMKTFDNTTGDLSETTYTGNSILSQSNYGASSITDTISLDPSGAGNGTGILSQNTTTGETSYINNFPNLIDMGVLDGATYQNAISLTYGGGINPPYVSLSSQDVVSGDNTTIQITSTQSRIVVDAGSGTDQTEITSTNDTILLKAPGFNGLPSVVYNKIDLTNHGPIAITTNNLKTNKSGWYLTTTNNTITTTFTYVPTTSTKAIYFKAYVTGVDSTLTNVYGAELFGVFKNNAGTITQVSTTDKSEKTLFSTATSDVDTDGTNIRVRVTGETGKNIDWQVRVEYND